MGEERLGRVRVELHRWMRRIDFTWVFQFACCAVRLHATQEVDRRALVTILDGESIGK